ncbi:hypothetical protein RvY_10287 [Ramazzottius varieornatus]|uniref:Uncharacterized protein n=1 Tax=Ramazzottius varieornatus TaxID=947166 RepID=A0A1D1VHN3_RAMVA|nr:hypothetical protein RvY_10287 [Ramazzottius varieornatus]
MQRFQTTPHEHTFDRDLANGIFTAIKPVLRALYAEGKRQSRSGNRHPLKSLDSTDVRQISHFTENATPRSSLIYDTTVCRCNDQTLPRFEGSFIANHLPEKRNPEK